MNKRPKSREETPKEGSDSARRYRTATICDRAAQNASAFNAFRMQNLQVLHAGHTSVPPAIFEQFQYLGLHLGKQDQSSPHYSRFRDRRGYQKCTPVCAQSCIQNASEHADELADKSAPLAGLG
jgi:hypothetical protein